MQVVEFFRKWTSDGGAKFHFDERLEVKEVPSEGFGVVALQDLAADARPLIVVPKFQQLRIENSDLSKVIDGIPDKFVALEAMIMRELALGSKSRWHAYLSCLPKLEEMHMPWLWDAADEDVVRDLIPEDSPFSAHCLSEEWARKLLPFITRNRTHYSPELTQVAAYKRIASWVMSRAHEEHMGHPFMVPVVDFLNTGVPSKINAAVHFEKDATVVRLLPGVEVKKGDQILISYGDGLSNRDLLLRYGFQLKDNPHDDLLVSGEVLLEMFDDHGEDDELQAVLDAALSAPFHIGIDGVIPPKLRDVVRLLLKKMTRQEFQQQWPQFDDATMTPADSTPSAAAASADAKVSSSGASADAKLASASSPSSAPSAASSGVASAAAGSNGHLAVWGSWFDVEKSAWGYRCCKSTVKDSKCAAASGAAPMAVDSTGSSEDGKDSKAATCSSSSDGKPKSSVLPGFDGDAHLAATLLSVLKVHADEVATDHLELLQKEVAATRAAIAKRPATAQELRTLARRLMAVEVMLRSRAILSHTMAELQRLAGSKAPSSGLSLLPVGDARARNDGKASSSGGGGSGRASMEDEDDGMDHDMDDRKHSRLTAASRRGGLGLSDGDDDEEEDEEVTRSLAESDAILMAGKGASSMPLGARATAASAAAVSSSGSIPNAYAQLMQTGRFADSLTQSRAFATGTAPALLRVRWTCASCTFVNTQSTQACEVCLTAPTRGSDGLPNGAEVIGSDDKPVPGLSTSSAAMDESSPSAASASAPGSVSRATAAGSARPRPPSIQTATARQAGQHSGAAQSGAGWSCPRCTYVNEGAVSNVCTMCEAPRPGFSPSLPRASRYHDLDGGDDEDGKEEEFDESAYMSDNEMDDFLAASSAVGPQPARAAAAGSRAASSSARSDSKQSQPPESASSAPSGTSSSARSAPSASPTAAGSASASASAAGASGDSSSNGGSRLGKRPRSASLENANGNGPAK